MENWLYQIDSLVDPERYPEAQPNTDDPYIELSWYALRRAQPVGPYASLIIGYDNLSPALRRDAERYIDEWFTHDEVTQLLTYLCLELGHTVSIRRLPVPMRIFLDDGSSIATPMARILEDPSWRLALTLSERDEGYPLPVEAGATYLVGLAFRSARSSE